MARMRIPPRSLLSQLQQPSQHTRPRPFPPRFLRPFSYPKEGVFQPNSPPRKDVPGFGPAPPAYPQQPQQHPPTQHFPQQTDSQQQQYGYPPPPPPPPPPQSRCSILSYRPHWYNVLLAACALLYGIYSVQRLDLLAPLEPGSEEDVEELEALFAELDNFALVQQLRALKSVDGAGDSTIPLFREYTAYSGVTDLSRRESRLTTGPLAGSAGVAAQRIFINESTGALLLFVNFGPGTCGWPNTVHGGAITTICDEALGRVAIRGFEGRTGVTANLEVNFVAPVNPGVWYVLVAAPQGKGGVTTTVVSTRTGRELVDDAKGGADGGGEQKLERKSNKRVVTGVLACVSEDAPVFASDDAGDEEQSSPFMALGSGPTLEDTHTPGEKQLSLVDMHPHATCNALFVAPKNVQLGPIAEDF